MDTDEKILKAALTEFAQKSYGGARTKCIAKEADFSELTLFRRFKNKKSLFERVYNENLEKFKEEVIALNDEMENTEFEDPREFINSYIERMSKIIYDNIELIRITIFDPSIKEELFKEIAPHGAQLLQKKLKNDNIDYFTLVLIMASTIILTMNNLYLERTKLDHDKFIKSITESFYNYIDDPGDLKNK
ncbi:MAG: TetR/AcrR family transcriptional regulator [Methanobacterium sp.]|nr:TetR/AcrR family transcriptional regulator [Methanobacterium sp.]